VRPLDDFAQLFTTPPLLLYLTAEPFEYPRSDWPPSVRMVSPCCWDPPTEPPSWLAELERPLVLISTSSEFQDDGRLVTIALEALAHEDVNVVATVPAQLQATAVPANARLEPFVSHTPLLARAACAVTHGGAGATQKALAAGVPVCVVRSPDDLALARSLRDQGVARLRGGGPRHGGLEAPARPAIDSRAQQTPQGGTACPTSP
jgi:UDP:flavonoid glycosyltransferase YjiC (YdhE family)